MEKKNRNGLQKSLQRKGNPPHNIANEKAWGEHTKQWKVNFFYIEHHFFMILLKQSKKSWFRFLVLIYGMTLCFLLVAAFVTAYVVLHRLA